MALLDALVRARHTLRVVCERKTCFFPTDLTMARYWQRVRDAERATFPDVISRLPEPPLELRPGELSQTELPWSVLDCDQFVVFSASYITGPLCDLLMAKGALNLHVGISPEYRGSAPNFWAEAQGHPELVGAQVQRLAKGLDAGEILAEVRPPMGGDPFLRGMAACRLGIEAMVDVLGRPTETWLPVRANDRNRQIHYSKHQDFTPAVVTEYLGRLDASTP